VIGAADTARLVRSGETTARREAEAALNRAAAATSLNAFIRLDPDGALHRAAAVDRIVAAGGDPGPLAGVPVALKDIIDQAGISTTAGSSFLDSAAETDATVVTRLEAAGAVIIGRTGLHEFAYGFSSENDWWGPVRNPWDPTTSPGGSSGGSAAAVAAGIAPLGIGTDTGGSVRVPAALCGVVGLKVTHGRIPLTGVFPLAGSLDTVGPITTTIADAAVAYGVLAGYDAADPWSIDRAVTGSGPVRIDGTTIGIPHPWVDRTLAPEQRAGFDHAISVLGDAGAELVDLEAPMLDPHDMPPGTYHEVADVHRDSYLQDPQRYGPTIRQRLAAVFDLTPDDVAVGARWRRSVVAAFGELFARCDVILTPTTAARTKSIGVDTIDVGDGPEPDRPVVSWFTPLVNQAGIPALAIPIETPHVSGLPPSLQLIGPAWSEARLLAIGMALDGFGLVAHRTAPPATPKP
jgi:Asp-tRNA(Asn)/Glu-tRNA(Gln) amidotransferase A subunit family amidase